MSKVQLIFAFCVLFGLVLYAEARRGGGYLEPVDIDDPEVVTFATWAAKKLKGKLIKVTSAHEQVVAGWMYHISMHIQSKERKEMKCRVKVWVRHWINRVRLVSAKCANVHA